MNYMCVKHVKKLKLYLEHNLSYFEMSEDAVEKLFVRSKGSCEQCTAHTHSSDISKIQTWATQFFTEPELQKTSIVRNDLADEHIIARVIDDGDEPKIEMDDHAIGVLSDELSKKEEDQNHYIIRFNKFCLLHESGHIHNKDVSNSRNTLKRFKYTAGAIGLITLSMISGKLFLPNVWIFQKIGWFGISNIFNAMIISYGLSFRYWIIRSENRANYYAFERL